MDNIIIAEKLIKDEDMEALYNTDVKPEQIYSI